MNRYIVMMLSAAIGVTAQCVPAQPNTTSSVQAYPNRTIRLVVPSSPGGSSDTLGRLMAQKVAASFGQQVVVDNRAGAGGIIGVDQVAKSAPDGYTLLITPASLAINPSMFSKLPYNAMRDLAPITQLVAAPNVLSLHPSVPAANLKALIALAKARPGSLVGGTSGIGTSPHLSAELFKTMAGIDMVLVHYKGSSHISLLSGEIALAFPTAITVIQYLSVGKLRALGVTTATRTRALPAIPTIAEAGLPGYEAPQWDGVLAPAGTPRPIIDRLYQELSRVLRAPDMKQRLSAEGTEVVASMPEEFASYIKSETEKWAYVIKAAGIKPE
jgi:tripartite-type tricarboxylate transporter receptor subunit TctC